jgi:hypothetical protein
MSMRFTNKKRTVCEVLREINDFHQEDTKHDRGIRKLLMEAAYKAKRITMKLYEYSKSKEYDKDWWEANPDYEKTFLKRMNENYKFEIEPSDEPTIQEVEPK